MLSKTEPYSLYIPSWGRGWSGANITQSSRFLPPDLSTVFSDGLHVAAPAWLLLRGWKSLAFALLPLLHAFAHVNLSLPLYLARVLPAIPAQIASSSEFICSSI